ncbi:30S ribosomal protein S8 [bacterium]|nr:30S ribosomal protein S8 [bacterium]
MSTYPISDMLTRIRNALTAEHSVLEMPSSKMKHQIARVLTEEKFIRGYKIVETPSKKRKLYLFLRYNRLNKPVIKGLRVISKPSRRHYVGLDSIPRVRNGLGVAILSTSKGILTDKQARMLRVGGEVICHVW